MVSLDFLQYLDPLKEKLVLLADIVKEKSGPLLERLKVLPYYPYSVIGAAAVILLLLILLVISRRRSAANAKPAKPVPENHVRPRVSGVAVGLSSHEEFNFGGETGQTASGTAAVPCANPPSAAPAVAVNAVTQPAPATPAPVPTAAPAAGSDADIEKIINSCQENFQAIYADMYMQFGLTYDFDKFKTEVINRLNDVKTTRRAISELKMTPHGLVLAHMAGVAGGFLQSGEFHIGRGQMNIGGHEFLSVYRYALDTMGAKGFASQDDVRNKLDLMEKKLLEIGG